MDSTNYQTNGSNTRRRLPRNLYAEVSSRGPLTRSRTALLNKTSEAVISTNPTPNGSQEEDMQTRKSYSDAQRPWSEQGDWNNLDVQEYSENVVLTEDQEIAAEIGQHSSDPFSVRPKKQATKPPQYATRVAEQPRSLKNSQNMVPQAPTSVAENRGTVNGSSLDNDDEALALKNLNLVRPTLRRTAHCNMKESTRTSISKTKCTGSPSKRVIWSLRNFILLLISSAVSYVIMSALWSSNNGKTHLSRAVNLEQFHERLTNLSNYFHHQRYELWHRSKIHLEKHLKTEEPTEPVSLIFTAGRSAEKTLYCLAVSVASLFSSALNASMHSIDGAGQAGHDGDEVKLSIDKQLEAAFNGEKPAVVIHRFEELPPRSTLIFYRYCDHESAAYKKVLLLFTVLLPQEDITSDQSLTKVEELVHDHLLEKLVDSNHAGFDEMDVNKFSGLWSRISHLILPVVSEEQMEKNGCKV